MKILKLVLLASLILSCATQQTDYTILVPTNASYQEKLAAREIQRYVYQRTDRLLPLLSADTLIESGGSLIVVAQKDQPVIASLANAELKQAIAALKVEEYVLKTWADQGKKHVLVCGGDAAGTLYGAYRLAEHLGVRFYLDSDVIPDQKIALNLANLDETGKPLFELRGIHPFHDFPEGPDWWNVDDYKAILAQLPKLRMNFFALHCYPERGWDPEPTVWIGLPEDVGADGQVRFAYPASYQNTLRGDWGYSPTATGQFNFGASQLFATDGFGAEVLADNLPRPTTMAASVEVFNRTGQMLADAFGFGRSLGVKTCIGTEVPLTVPQWLRERLQTKGIELNEATVQQLYEGMFSRIQKQQPLDYYWLWTDENWTWSDIKDEQVQAVEKDLQLAVAASKNVNAPFTLATCGWVLGPPKDRAQFDRVLPKEMPFSCINRQVGFERVEPDFKVLQGRPKWAIPWLEDDPGLISPQLWVGRMRRDALDALDYGCTGLMGIHWRTRILGPNVAALAQAAWEQSSWQKSLPDTVRDQPCLDFYLDWAMAQFGVETAVPLARLFARIDGGPYCRFQTQLRSNLLRTSDWQGGPGGIIIRTKPWDSLKQEFAFVDEMVSYETKVPGKGQQERFRYWLDTFRYTRSMAQIGCVLGQLDSLMKQIAAEPDLKQKRQLAIEQALPMRLEATRLWGEMMTCLLQTVSTTGELGTVANLEQHNLRQLGLLTKHDSTLAAISGSPLPEALQPWPEYRGQPRLIVPTRRSLLENGEDLKLKVIVLAADPVQKALFRWRPLGKKNYQSIPVQPVARGVYQVTLPADQIEERTFEYNVRVDIDKGQSLVFPASAPEINQVVVVL